MTISPYLNHPQDALAKAAAGLAVGDTVRDREHGEGVVRALAPRRNPPEALVEFPGSTRWCPVPSLALLFGEPQQ